MKVSEFKAPGASLQHCTDIGKDNVMKKIEHLWGNDLNKPPFGFQRKYRGTRSTI